MTAPAVPSPISWSRSDWFACRFLPDHVELHCPPGTSGAGQGTGDLEPCLVGRWLHSHDEDTPDVLVYRPADYPFPREEGRDGFEILAGGEFYYLGIGRGDGTEVSNGRWTIEAPGRVRIDVNNNRVKPFWLEVISCDAETLKVKR